MNDTQRINSNQFHSIHRLTAKVIRLVQFPIELPPKSSITLIVCSKGRQAEEHVIFVYQPRKQDTRL